jgi:hypothetical protein
MTKSYIVQLKIPDGYNVKDMQHYIKEAVEMWCKQAHPDDSIFDLEVIKVVPFPNKKRKKK